MTVFATLREACAAVVCDGRFLEYDSAQAERLADEARTRWSPPQWDRATHFHGDDDALLAYVLVLDTLNFGSGWFPSLRKRSGRSGYFSISLGLKERFERDGPLPVSTLERFSPKEVAELLGQPPGDAALVEFFGLAAKALRDLGALLAVEYGGSFAELRREAGVSAEAMVHTLGRMPLFRDVAATATGVELPFYKRAQITVADLALAFGTRGFGEFADLDQLTAFADNTLPHVLRCEGVLRYDPALAAKVDEGVELESGSPEEIEIRASAVHSVEGMCRHLRGRGDSITPREIDAWLWARGQMPAYKARPRHRTRCGFY